MGDVNVTIKETIFPLKSSTTMC